MISLALINPAHVLAALAAIAVGAGCTPLAKGARAARSSLGCIETAIAGRGLEQIPDSKAHCVAAGLIARYCSVPEAALASVGKELRDAFGHGDAEWRDLASDRRGIRCAERAASEGELLACCESGS